MSANIFCSWLNQKAVRAETMNGAFNPIDGLSQAIAYRVPDAAKAIGVSRSTIYNLVSQGKLRLRKVAGRSLIAREVLVALLDS